MDIMDPGSIQPPVFDYPALEELDPSLVDGYQLFYEREVPMELRSAVGVDSPTELGALEAIRAKILIKPGDGGRGPPKSIRVELSCESNVFFLYAHTMEEAGFKELQESQRLMVEFADYPTVLMRMLNSAIREPHVHLAVLIMQPTGEARLDFIQNMEYKFVELLSVRFVGCEEELVRAHVTYRYNLVKARNQLLLARLQDVNAALKVKAPSLLLQLQRTPPRAPGMMGPPPMAAMAPPPPSAAASPSKPFYT